MKKTAQNRSDDHFDIRIWHRKKCNKKSPRYLLKCGCCDKKLEIFYDDESLEIDGVNGSIKNWREILLPLLELG